MMIGPSGTVKAGLHNDARPYMTFSTAFYLE